MDALKNKTRDKIQFITLAVFLLIPGIMVLFDHDGGDRYYRTTRSTISVIEDFIQIVWVSEGASWLYLGLAVLIGKFVAAFILSQETQNKIAAYSRLNRWGIHAALALIIGGLIASFFVIPVLGTLILGFFVYIKKDRLKKTIFQENFGTGLIALAASLWISWMMIAGMGWMIKTNNPAVMIALPVYIAGVYFLQRNLPGMKKAWPFVAFIVTVGFLFFKLQAASSRDGDNVAVDDADSSSFLADDTMGSMDMMQSPVIDTTTPTIDAGVADNMQAAAGVTAMAGMSQADPTPVQDIFSQAQQNAAVNSVDITDNSGMTQMSIDGDTGIIRGADNMPIGTVQDDAFGHAAMIDNGGMTIAQVDNAGFISDGDGQAVAHVDHNAVDTVQSTDSKDFTVKDNINGVVYDGHTGKQLGMVKDKD
ncbi:hypothetical protein [Mitsuokella multacida]|uniref:hypothetical protein n=1 Tax=Mitsuokella multacida TaxID=52226 RepID=UPI0022E16A33|nr:hypothetical protein [Mitsuokella multacida]